MTTPGNLRLAKLLVKRRQKLGMSTREVAKAAGITHGGLYRIEEGTRNPRVGDTLQAVAGALRCTFHITASKVTLVPDDEKRTRV